MVEWLERSVVAGSSLARVNDLKILTSGKDKDTETGGLDPALQMLCASHDGASRISYGNIYLLPIKSLLVSHLLQLCRSVLRVSWSSYDC